MGWREEAHLILGDTSLRRNTTWTFSGYLMFVYREPVERVSLVSAALTAAEEAARISPKSGPKDGGDVKEHDRSVSEELTSFKDRFPVDDSAFEFVFFVDVRRETGPRNTNAGV